MAKYRVKAPDGSTLEFDGPDNASDAEVMQYAQSQYAAGETTLPKTEAGLLNVGGDALKLGSNLATGLAAPVFGVGSAIRTGSMEGFNAGTEGFAEGTHMDYSKKDGWAAETEKKIQHLLEKITELGGEAAVKTSDAMKYLPGLPGLTARAISGNEPLVRTLGEAATNFIPFERGIAGLRSIGKGKPNIAAEARAMAARDMAPPKVEPTMAPPETPLPTLDEKVPHIQEPPAPTGETPLPVIDHPVDEWNGIKLNRDAQPPVEPQGLSIASADEPIPHQPGPLEKQLPLKTPEDTLADALLSKDLGDNWVDQMRDNTRTNELRGEMASVDFPLRQEVLDHPAIKEAINNFRMEAERLKDQPEALAKLQEEFAAGMKQLGIEKPSDAYGKGLYDSGKGTALPIEKTNRPPLPSEPGRGWTAIIDEQPLAIKGPAKRIGGWNKQSGAIDPKVFVEGFRKILGTKVATPDGLPRIMYHGTSKDVPYKNIKPTSRGAWFTARSDDASSYAIENDSQRMRYEGGKYVPVNTASRVLPVYLDIKNPKILTSAENQKFHNSAGGNYAKSQSQYIAQAKREGYDGLMSEDGEIAIAFNKEQIHSALSGPDHLGNTKFGKSQRGGLGDPEFRKFKNRLPENLKRYAGPMYKEYKKAMAEGPVETTPNANAMNAISKIDGLHGVVDEVAPINEKPWAEIKQHVLQEPDIELGAWGKLWRTGAQLTGFETKNTLIRYTGDITNAAVRRGLANIQNHLLDSKTGLKTLIDGLDRKEQAELWKSMQTIEGREADAIYLNDRQQAALKKYREIDDKVFSTINDVRQELGMKPLKARPNHIASRWRGDFMVPVMDKTGNVVTIITARTGFGAKQAKSWLSEHYPDYTFGETQRRSKGAKHSDVESGFDEIMSMFEADDPAVATIQDAYQKYLSEQAFGYENFKRHFEYKRDTPMGGFEGGKEWLSPEQNAKEGFKSSMKYMESAFRWAEIQRAEKKLKDVLSDPDLKGQENARSFAKAYWHRASGKSTELAKAIDDITNIIGFHAQIGGPSIREAGHVLKAALTLKALGAFNISFGFSQAYQPLQMMPHWLTYLKQKGAKANMAVSGAKAERDIHVPREQMTPFGKDALEWAEVNHIADSLIIDEVRNATTGPMIDAVDKSLRLAPTLVEKWSRYQAFMNYAHFLNDSGVPKMQAIESAAKMTDMTMTNYHAHERPMLYSQLGFVGDMASSLTTFKHNQWHQLRAFGEKGRRSNLIPMIGAQLFAGGLLGFYGRDELDSAIKSLNDLMAATGMSDTYIPTTKEYLLKKAPDWALFGGVSKVTGLDVSSRFSAADVVPNGVGEMFFPFLGDITRMVEAAGDVVARGGSDESLKKAANAFAPSSLKWATELEKRNGVTIDPRTDKGLYRRNPEDETARKLGAYTMAESKVRQQTFEAKTETQWRQKLVNNIMEKARDADGEGLIDLGIRYVKLGGDEKYFVRSLKQHQRDQMLTAFQREKGTKANTMQQKMQIMRALEYERNQ